MRGKQIVAAIALLAAVALYWREARDDGSREVQVQAQPSAPNRTAQETLRSHPLPTSEEHQVQLSSFSEAVEARRSERWMTVSVRVVKTLPTDNEGSRHQRFIVEGRDGNTVLVAHNIDLAKAVPLKRNDVLEVRGRYEWNSKGGVLHWTHHDPAGRKDGGWIRHQRIEYR